MPTIPPDSSHTHIRDFQSSHDVRTHSRGHLVKRLLPWQLTHPAHGHVCALFYYRRARAPSRPKHGALTNVPCATKRVPTFNSGPGVLPFLPSISRLFFHSKSFASLFFSFKIFFAYLATSKLSQVSKTLTSDTSCFYKFRYFWVFWFDFKKLPKFIDQF